MKKIDIINLIKAHVSGDEDMFRQIANKVANEFYNDGDPELSDMISSLIYTNHTLVPQSQDRMIGSFLKLEDVSKGQLILPDNIINEMINKESSFNKTIKESKYWQKCIIDDVLFLRSFCLHKDSHLLDPSLLDILKNVLSGKPISLLFGRVDESMLNRYDDINHNTSLYLENNFCCYIELLRYIKNIMSEEIYILEINDIKYLIFKNNYN